MNIKCATIAGVFLALGSAQALAVNYPTELRVGVQGGVTQQYLLVGFNNNEGDRVRFDYEINADGVLWPQWGVDAAVNCVSHSADADDCKGASKLNLRDGWTTQKGWRAVVVSPLNLDTEYCIRVYALGDNNKRSAWTPWGCARTVALPRPPSAAPPTPSMTLLDAGTDGKGRVGGPTPGRVLVEWTWTVQATEWYTVERKPASAQNGWTEAGRVMPYQGAGADMELVDSITDLKSVPSSTYAVDYRVCTNNAGGKTCSGQRQFPRFAAELVALSPRAKVLLGAGTGSNATSATASVSPTALALPAPASASAVLKATSTGVAPSLPKLAASPSPSPSLGASAKPGFGGTTPVASTSFAKSTLPISTTPLPMPTTPAASAALNSARPAAGVMAPPTAKSTLDWSKAGGH